mmetsp:Transcript_10411/g.18992  ORF Transcript_10411/g.18992 Transcript_10411/m.18992 type:complete len:398 (-) Transcript_10411:50-1243(-)
MTAASNTEGVALDKSDRCMAAFSSWLRGALVRAQKQWFILCVIFAIFFAKAAPYIGKKGGPLKPSLTVKLAVGAIFFSIGLSLKTRQLRDTFFQWRIHVTVQTFTLFITPLVVCSVANGVETAIPYLLDVSHDRYKSIISLIEGVKILSCMPSPVSSAVILTKAIGANEAAAVFNSTLGSFLGVMVTPFMLLQIIGQGAQVPILSMGRDLGSQIILPIIFGQFLRNYVISNPDALIKRFSISKISSGVLVYIIYTVFCDTFSGNVEIDIDLLAVLVLVLLTTMCFLMCLVYLLASTIYISLNKADLVAILFCSSHKSLTLGMPLLKILFGRNQKISLAVISLPLLIYHPLQILLGTCLIGPLQRWVKNDLKTAAKALKASSTSTQADRGVNKAALAL